MLGFFDNKEYSLSETLAKQTPYSYNLMVTNIHNNIMSLVVEPGNMDYWLNPQETVMVTTKGEENFKSHLVFYSSNQVRLYAQGKSQDIQVWLKTQLLSVGHNRPAELNSCTD